MDARFLRYGVGQFLAGIALLVATHAASAQATRTTFGSNPVGGSQSAGSSSLFGSSSRSPSSAQTATPQRTTGGTSGATARPGGTTAGGMGAGTNAAAAQNVAEGFVPIGAENLQAPGGFVGRGADQGPFVGRPGTEQNANGRGNTTGSRTGRGLSRQGQFGQYGQLGQYGQNGLNPDLARGGTNRGNRAGGQLRVVYRPAFSAELAAVPESMQRINNSLVKSPVFSAASGLSVEADGDVVVLRGQVSSEYNRQLAERMAMLRPGVSQVRNELVVSK